MQNITRRALVAQLRTRTTRIACRALATQASSQVGSLSTVDRRALWATAAAAATALGVTAMGLQEGPAFMEKAPDAATVDDQIHPNNYPPPRPDLPTYTMEEVAEHADDDSMWFTFR